MSLYGFRGFESLLLRQRSRVRPGDIGNTLYRRDRLHIRSERVVDGLQGSLLEVNVSEVIVHEGDEPDSVIDLLDSDSPSSRRATKRSLSSIFDCSFHGISTSRQSEKCYPCVRYNLSPMSRAAQKHNLFAAPHICRFGCAARAISLVVTSLQEPTLRLSTILLTI